MPKIHQMDLESEIAFDNPKTSLFIKEYCPKYFIDNNEWRFLENHPKYYVCCGLFHVRFAIIALTAIKTCFVLWYATWQLMWSNGYAIFTLTSIFGISLILSSYAFLIIGVIVKKYTLLIPYFTLCMFLILILVMKLFVIILETANTKNTLEPEQLTTIIGQSFIISIEIYSVVLVLRGLNYITDYYVEKDYLWNVKVSDQRKQWQMQYTKGFDEYMRQKLELEIAKDSESQAEPEKINEEEEAEPFLKKQTRKKSQQSTTSSSD